MKKNEKSYRIGDRFLIHNDNEDVIVILCQTASETFALINPLYGNQWSNARNYSGIRHDKQVIACHYIPKFVIDELVCVNKGFTWKYYGGPLGDVKMTTQIDGEDLSLKDALGTMTEEWVDDGQYTDENVIDLINACKKLLLNA